MKSSGMVLARLFAGVLAAQTNRGVIGTVFDKTGAVVPSATVR